MGKLRDFLATIFVRLREARDVLLVGLAMIIAGVLAWTIGADAFERTFQVSPLYQHGERASLVVFAMSVVALLITLVNIAKIARTGTALAIRIPDWMQAWLAAFAAISVGVLIGTTIFR